MGNVENIEKSRGISPVVLFSSKSLSLNQYLLPKTIKRPTQTQQQTNVAISSYQASTSESKKKRYGSGNAVPGSRYWREKIVCRVEGGVKDVDCGRVGKCNTPN